MCPERCPEMCPERCPEMCPANNHEEHNLLDAQKNITVTNFHYEDHELFEPEYVSLVIRVSIGLRPSCSLSELEKRRCGLAGSV